MTTFNPELKKSYQPKLKNAFSKYKTLFILIHHYGLKKNVLHGELIKCWNIYILATKTTYFSLINHTLKIIFASFFSSLKISKNLQNLIN